MTTSYQIEKNLYLVKQSFQLTAAKPTTPPNVNHIAIIDCSGSMTYDLPQLRNQLKLKLPKLIGEGDTLSMVWFSGRGQFGVLFENEPVATLKDLKGINDVIDRWLKPVGMTGFKEPIQEVTNVIKRAKNKNPWSLFFMSDGGENQWSRAEVLQAVTTAAQGLSSATFVEYGNYADRQLLSQMASAAGGTHVHADRFDKFEPIFTEAMHKKVSGVKRAEVKIPGDPIGGFVWEMTNDRELVAYDVQGGKALVAADVKELFYLSPAGFQGHAGIHHPSPPVPSSKDHQENIGAFYAAMSLFATRMKPDIVYPLLKATGDACLIRQFSTCFGKQKYTEFMNSTKDAAFYELLRLREGYDPNLVPPDDAFTVFDLLHILAEHDSTKVLLDHKEFVYNRISRAQVDADENFSADEMAQLSELTLEQQKAKTPKQVKEVQAKIDAIMSSKKDALKFVADPAPDGYDIASLTFNEKSPNISILVKKTGHVDLEHRLDSAGPAIHDKVPPKFKTFIWRNYSIVAHGIVNVEKLPVKIDEKLQRQLGALGTVMEDHEDDVTVIDLRKLPILNRKMVKSVSAKESIELEYKLTQEQAYAKVYKDYRGDLFPSAKVKGWTEFYGADATAWLKDQGFTEYSGFSPKKVQAESTDVIAGKELDIKLKGYSTLPPVAKVKQKAGSKLNGPETLMAEAIVEVEDFLKNNPKKLHEQWLTGKEKTAIANTRSYMFKKSQNLFSIIVGQTWYKEFKTLDDKTMDVTIGKTTVTGTCELKEVEIKI